ncbi:outer membrane receptor for ferric coprogen and ferric-rhodotorulic acid [Rhodoferax lacus]|uniref:Outer membrane receptor for ferric coprogen and ferric-rhodotorulic acid n=1 Tax=Rhodoferax lacus TaxID=2184758 RepID=A0A3E1R8T6_9BURK|nr:putative porin [Rhodoferax lacus]RFO95774.1 outer membrane receptor for ferric coprogen and ferric-rhodotorulic acid [Rhodoferax lacus]
MSYKNLKRNASAAACAVLLLATLGPAHADEAQSLEALRQTTLGLIQALVQQGFLTQEKADQLVRQAQQKGNTPLAAVPEKADKKEVAPIRVPYVPEFLKKQITDQVREEVIAQAKAERWADANAIPEWVDRVKVEGDMRVGLQTEGYSSQNAASAAYLAANGQAINEMSDDRTRLRMRARLGVNAKVTQDLSTSLRLTTGSAADPLSTSQTLGASGTKTSFALDRAFMRYHDDEALPWLTATAGRMANPWFGTDLVWNDNLTLDGVQAQFDPAAKSDAVWRPFAGTGLFALQDIETSVSNKGKSKWMVGVQGGVEWVPDTNKRAKIGLGYYDYQNVSGVRNSFGTTTTNSTAPGFRQKGNTLFDIANDGGATSLYALANDYQILNLTAMLDLNLYDPVHVISTLDYVENIGFSQSKTLDRTGINVARQTTGYMARVAVGMPSMLLRGDWQASVAYRYLEADAVLDSMTDSDFHLGGTNNRGYVLGLQYGLGRNNWVSARWLSSNEVSGPPLTVNALQVYFNAKF